jgi:hypothetical protein
MKQLLLLSILSFTFTHSYLIHGVIDSKLSNLVMIFIIDKGLRNLDYSSTKVILNQGEYTGFVDNMGTFNM